MKWSIPVVLFLAITLTLPGWHEAPRYEAQIEYVHTFARLYGYVRYFHPSDQTAETNWDIFAVHGVRSVQQATGTADLLARLRDLFGPIAPTMDIFRTADGPPPLPAELTPEDAEDLNLVAWQHRGVGTGRSRTYASSRLHRDDQGGPSFGVLMQSMPAEELRGRPIRMIAEARADVEDDQGQLQLWMRVDRPDRQMGYFDNMDDRPITSPDWAMYEITGTVDDDAVAVAFGAFLMGAGKAWVDDVRLEVQDDAGHWEVVQIPNAGFEEGGADASPAMWISNGANYAFSTEPVSEGGMGRSAAIEFRESTIPGALFAAHPEPGEVRIKSIGSGLSVRLPVGLYSRDGRTLGTPEQHDLKEFRTTLDSFHAGDLWPENEAVRLASVVVAWNVLQHFFPYFDVIDADWEAVLTETLEAALDDADVREFVETLKGMLAHLKDGHASAAHAVTSGDAWFSFRPEVIEGQLIVVATHLSSQFLVGDVITSVDGRPALEYLAEEMNRWSGSEWWRQHRAVNTFGRGPRDEEVEVGLVRDGEELELTETRSISRVILEERPPHVTEIAPDIFYVNLGRAEMAEIRRRIDDLSQADGVIFDLRGYPNGNHDILNHLTDRTIHSATWDVPQVIYPDREGLAFDTTRRWTLPPAEPRITGKVVFLTDESAISYAESVMGIVEAYRLGEIIGRPTAGTNGNVNRVILPGVVSISFTGMRVQKHDNSRLYGVGVQPTIPLERTVEAVRDGRDEYLERAVEVIRAGG